MTDPKVLSGKDTAIAAYESFKDRIYLLSAKGITPGLCVILVGEDPASKIYVRTKTKKLKSLIFQKAFIFYLYLIMLEIKFKKNSLKIKYEK